MDASRSCRLGRNFERPCASIFNSQPLRLGVSVARRRTESDRSQVDAGDNHAQSRVVISIAIFVVVGLLVYRHKTKSTSKPNFGLYIPELIDVLLVLIRAGQSPAAAMAQLHYWAPDNLYKHLIQVHNRLIQGERFADVMKTLRDDLGSSSYPLCDILVSADRDGLPITSVLDQLAYHAHLERCRLQDINARQLPVRLLLPLTCCILPSFILLAMVPLVVNSLSAVSAQLF